MSKYTAKQLRRFYANRAAAKKAGEATPAVASEATQKAPRKPVIMTLSINSVEERTSEKAGVYAFAKVHFTTKKGEEKTGKTAMAFGEAYAAVKEALVPGATVNALVKFNRSLNLVGIAA